MSRSLGVMSSDAALEKCRKTANQSGFTTEIDHRSDSAMAIKVSAPAASGRHFHIGYLFIVLVFAAILIGIFLSEQEMA